MALLGPPEIHHSTLTTTTTNNATATSAPPARAPPNPFVDLMTAHFNTGVGLPAMGRTENNSATFVSSGNPCLDFFFQIVPDTAADTLVSLVESSWKQDPLTALKLVCHLRGVRGTGKSDEEGFYTAALWLHKHHPKTLALNIRWIAEFGYLKDLLEVLHRLLYGADVRKVVKEEREKRLTWRIGRGGRMMRRRGPIEKKRKKWSRRGIREERLAAEKARVKIEVDEASRLRKKKRAEMTIRVIERYNGDTDFRLLHDQIADFFSELLLADLEHLRSGETNKISLGAKWCPSIDSSFDRSTLLCESIARRVFPKDSYQEYAEIEEEHYVYRVRDRLRKEVLVPLRKVLELPEVYISDSQWNLLPYNRVASVAMKTYKKLFEKHDRERFAEYLGRVREGKTTIAAGAILPHEMLAAVYEEEEDEVAELQWRRMVDDLKNKGKLRNSVAVCDVSGSMEGTPMDVCVALGLLTSELSEEPWKGSVITFSEEPQLHKITGGTLKEKASFVKSMDWGFNTNFQAVFDRILQVAVKGNLAEEQMIRRVFVFSDMEFDEAAGNSWETDYMAIHAGDCLLEFEGFKVNARAVRTERGGIGERILKESDDCVLRRGWGSAASECDGSRHCRGGIQESCCI